MCCDVMFPLIVLFSLMVIPQETLSYKILMVPYSGGFNSRLLNVQKLADILAQDGHEVTVLMNTKVANHRITKYAKMLEFHTEETIGDVGNFKTEPTSAWNMFAYIDELIGMELSYFSALIRDRETLDQIHNANYDLVISDFNYVTGVFLVSHLNITTMWYQNFFQPSDSGVYYPILPSFVCTMPGIVCGSGEMHFKERLINTLTHFVFTNFVQYVFGNPFLKLAEENNFPLLVPFNEITKNKIIVVNSDYVLDMPTPKMPHVFPISGLFHKEPLPLDDKMSAIIDASHHGVVLVSFGSMVSEINPEKADIFARVLGRLSQQVIWKFSGPAPKSLKANTHLVDWFPQNDLLANPAVKLFVTHCGISSTFESAFHGVPIVALPLVGDQPANADKLTGRAKIGVRRDFATLTEQILEDAIQEVLSNPLYKENAKKTSFLLTDRLVSPRQQFRHLVNFTVKTGGAPHLFHPYAADMSWFTFYSLDVIFFLLTIVFVFCLITFYIARFFLRCFCGLIFGKKAEKPHQS